ncbi:MAG: hypothetical protein HYU36_17365 [Planctomycetes bacterium]|nr:hypothetical protein [Planctomycetota bacterium]
MGKYQIGDRVVYHKTKHSTHPTSRAQDMHPAEHGDEYSYIVDKYWTVVRVLDDRTIEVRTRKGKVHHLDVNDPLLRKAGPLESWWYRDQFPSVEAIVPAQ